MLPYGHSGKAGGRENTMGHVSKFAGHLDVALKPRYHTQNFAPPNMEHHKNLRLTLWLSALGP